MDFDALLLHVTVGGVSHEPDHFLTTAYRSTSKRLPTKMKTKVIFTFSNFFFFKFFRFWLGGAAPQTARDLAGGAQPAQTPPKNG